MPVYHQSPFPTAPVVSRGLKHMLMLVADPTQEAMAMHISQNDVLTMTSGPSIGHSLITIGVDTTYPVSTLTTTLITPLDTTNHHPTTIQPPTADDSRAF